MYEGFWENDMRHGKGTYVSMTQGWVFMGDWVEGKQHGEGKLSYF